MDTIQRRIFTPEFKVQVVLESLQRDTTIEATCRKYGVSTSVIMRWRVEFKQRASDVFVDKRNIQQKVRLQGYAPGQSPDELKRIIGEITVQNEILKKVQRLLG